MRRLLYIPIIHEATDLGSAGAALAQRSAALAGQRNWSLHQQTVAKFWQEIASYLLRLPAHLLRIYQDGLPVGGALGRRVVEEAAARGSRNYQLVLELLDKGAQLRPTEDSALLLQEYENMRNGMPAGAGQDNRIRQGQLTAERDDFIAATINATLQPEEVGVLFIGADHQVDPRLASDIQVTMLREPHLVRDYLQGLFEAGDGARLEKLARRLSRPVKQHLP